ncbi:hypothetical protein JCM14469_40140 [Desulfatiferula olefinivorans]
MISSTLRFVFSRCIFSIVFVLLMTTRSLAENTPMSDDTMIQAMFGIFILDEDSTTLKDSTDNLSTGVSTLPVLSIVGQIPIATGRAVIAGFEAGGELSWLRDESKIISNGGETLVYLKNKMVMGNVLMGGFISTDPDAAVRLYTGAGATLNWGHMDVDSDFMEASGTIHINETESSFGYGAYLRCGIDFMLADGGLVGLCGKISTARLDYESSFSRESYNGFQIMMTYTASLSDLTY